MVRLRVSSTTSKDARSSLTFMRKLYIITFLILGCLSGGSVVLAASPTPTPTPTPPPPPVQNKIVFTSPLDGDNVGKQFTLNGTYGPGANCGVGQLKVDQLGFVGEKPELDKDAHQFTMKVDLTKPIMKADGQTTNPPMYVFPGKHVFSMEGVPAGCGKFSENLIVLATQPPQPSASPTPTESATPVPAATKNSSSSPLLWMMPLLVVLILGVVYLIRRRMGPGVTEPGAVPTDTAQAQGETPPIADPYAPQNQNPAVEPGAESPSVPPAAEQPPIEGPASDEPRSPADGPGSDRPS